MSVFNDQAFEKKLLGLKDSQESISTLSDWCLQHKQHHKKIVATWLSVLKKVRVENRLTLFYLANDVIQYSKRKNYDFVESWGTALQKATTMVRHDKVMIRIMRIFKIWGERNVYNEEFLTDLRGLLTAKKATPATPQAKPSDTPTTAPVATSSTEFNASNLFDRMHRCKDLEDDTDLKLKVVNDCKLVNFNDLEAFRTMLKDRKHADGVAGELDDAISQVEAYRKALEIEISERKTVIDLLQQGSKFYETEKNDARVVFNAYRNFSSRVKSLKRKLDELIPTLSSPVPSPDVNAPSPSPDSDIDLPNDDDLSGKLMQNTRRVSPPPRARTQGGDMDNMPNCFSSFMGGGALPFDIKSNFFVDDGSNRANILGTSEDEPEESPPSFEKESFRQPVEYDDTVHNRKSDVDHRSFLSHSSSPKDVDHRILNNRFKKDVDHRNLISLTGSPRELQPPPLPPNLWGDVDQDYRTPPPSKQQSRPGDNVESVDMEMSDEEEIERHQDKGRSREHSPSKKSVGGSQAPESPIKDREELGKSRSPHLPNPSKTTPQRFNVPPPTTRPPFPPPPRPLFPDAQFAPSLGGDFNKFSMPPIPPPPALPLSGPPPGLPLRLRHPGMNFLPPNLTLPPNPLLAIQNRSPVPAALVAQRTLEASPSHSMPTSTTQQVTPSGTQSSGPEESDTESIGQYLNMGLSDDEEIKEMVASMDPQLLQEVVDGINIGNGSDKLDLSSLMPNNGEIEEGDGDWNGQGDFVDPNNRGRPWKPSRLSVPGTPPGLAMPHPSMSPGAPRFRGHGLNWRSPPMHERGGRGRGFYRPFRGRGPPMPRQPYGGNW
ncbi:regulation of nuclear pre-mRNA domain-containing protein 2 isoform X3 [Frankliniella occidentalis]|uniref:Regulation of nuclear pre-mRNA domain-containing protein 2 n=1 Tax=Frankliniella occidentalis TaxID=133901 RepID=A0A6J1S4Q8_FRAOC|nr:regulation of nuclear pre-mRNA domain-containing protein 2 isoform X3 [Frankliniella occidentalis]